MKLVTYQTQNTTSLGILIADDIFDLQQLNASLPNNMRAFLFAGDDAMNAANLCDTPG